MGFSFSETVILSLQPVILSSKIFWRLETNSSSYISGHQFDFSTFLAPWNIWPFIFIVFLTEKECIVISSAPMIRESIISRASMIQFFHLAAWCNLQNYILENTNKLHPQQFSIFSISVFCILSWKRNIFSLSEQASKMVGVRSKMSKEFYTTPEEWSV